MRITHRLPLLRPAIVLLSALALVVPRTAAAAAATPTTETATSGAVTASFSYTPTTDSYGLQTFQHMSIQIARGGTVVYSAPIGTINGLSPNPAEYGSGPSVQARDLDNDGEPEILIDLFTGGANCCQWTYVYHYSAAANSYTLLKEDWDSDGYKLQSLAGASAPPVFVTDDNRFAIFGPFVIHFYPIRILAFRAGAMKDVTRSYPKYIARDAAQTWHSYLTANGQYAGARQTTIAAWVADEYLLGHRRLAQQRLAAALRSGKLKQIDEPKPARFVAMLNKLLRRAGYG